MDTAKQRVLLKISGEAFLSIDRRSFDTHLIRSLVDQIKQLERTHQFAIVLGGGNILRGKISESLNIATSSGHQIGILSTIINGLLFQDICNQLSLKNILLTAISIPSIAPTVSRQEIDHALQTDTCIIFTAGTGNSFFTTDTTAVLRALQIGSAIVWKGTKVNGVYSADPRQNKSATFLPHVSYDTILAHHLAIMDRTAIALAQEHDITIRVFNIFEENALLRAAKDQNFGSIIHNIEKESHD